MSNADTSPPSPDGKEAAGALAGLRVLDLSRILAGPWCTQILADLGADVIKVERPVTGDDTRHWGPPFVRDSDGKDTDLATYFTCCNRNKKSIAVDMAHPEGQSLLRALAEKSDIIVENFKVGGLAAYGLDYASLSAVNPRLIYCSITGFGQTGPYANRAGYDLLVQAAGGLMSITGRPDDEPGGGPMRIGVAVIDLFTGVYASTAILAAVQARHATGRGQYIDMALLDVSTAMLANQGAAFLNTGRVPERQGNTHPSIVPYQDFPTADGAMLLAIGNDGQFARFCEAVAHPEWAWDPRFATNADRVRHRTELVALMAAQTRTRTTSQWISLLESRAVPCGPINNLAGAFADPQVQARGLQVRMPGRGSNAPAVQGVASPLRLSKTPPVQGNAPPGLGEHTDDVLRGLGLAPEQIIALRAAGVVG